MIILCNLLIILCQLIVCWQNLNRYFAHWQFRCCLGRLSIITDSVKGGPLDIQPQTAHGIRTDLEHMLKIICWLYNGTYVDFITSPCIRIWLCMSDYLLLCAWSMLGNGGNHCNSGYDMLFRWWLNWFRFWLSDWERGTVGILTVLWMSIIACKYYL